MIRGSYENVKRIVLLLMVSLILMNSLVHAVSLDGPKKFNIERYEDLKEFNNLIDNLIDENISPFYIDTQDGYFRGEEKPGKWIQSNGKWWYKHNDGTYTKNNWEYIKGKFEGNTSINQEKIVYYKYGGYPDLPIDVNSLLDVLKYVASVEYN